MKNLILCLLFLFQYTIIHSQETFQIEAFSAIGNEKFVFSNVVDKGNDQQVFIGNIYIDGFNNVVIGVINKIGEIVESYRLDIDGVFDEIKHVSAHLIEIHPDNEISIVIQVGVNIYIIRTDNTYNVKYCKLVNVNFVNSRFIVADNLGNTYINARSSGSPVIIKIDTNGNVLWSKYISVSEVNDIELMSNGNLVITYNNILQFYGMGIAILDASSGEIIHSKLSNTFAFYIAIDEFDNVILFYDLDFNNYSNFVIDANLIKLDSELNLIWSRKVNLNNSVFVNYHKKIMIDHNNDIVIGSYDTGSPGVSLLKIDSDGNEVFRKVFLDGDNDNFGSIMLSGNKYMAIINKVSDKNSRIIKVSEEIETVECSSYNYCNGLEEGDAIIEFGEIPTIFNGGPNINIDGFLLESFDLFSERVSGPSLPPDAYFAFENETFCLGEFLKFKEDSISAVGKSSWKIENDIKNSTWNKKYPGDILLDVSGEWTITHNLTINNCLETKSITFTVIQPLVLDFLDTIYSICDDEILDLQLINEVTDITWSDGNMEEFNVFSDSGSYFVQYKDEVGCEHQEVFFIQKKFSPTVYLSEDTLICEDESYFLGFEGIGIDTFHWEDGLIDSIRKITQEGSYSLIAENDCGSTIEEHIATYRNCEFKTYFPNVFTPNGDGINDVFVVSTINQTIGKCVIYDRWGSIVYQSELEISWDGKHHGQEVKQGVFAYTVELIDDERNISIKNGTITVIR